ncbi:DUF6414 family protein [Clostridium thermopalmarium]|uniref:Uncharacterized protein n=1 Tax=Clostridium thermopalmarium DSM 5974 TaxID=1121340 RepID=A0A2T0AZH1_9CLOT|nr:DUF6414 family protein [Clostridium thermopalmarium]PRR76609.1 hypothetical protein CPAL_02800 [Clostridium thermopalmarium DSM 5974]PVZ28278.1 hypothetical protein LX19_00249 [Clostridium thermopalmarium DSM 5974]
MAKAKKQKERKIIKVVYFDEQAARDYIDIVNGGRLDWSTEEDKEKLAKIVAEIDAEIGGGFKLLTWLKASLNSKVGSEYNRETKSIIGAKLTSTLLTDYISIASADDTVYKFNDCIVYAPENSISIYKMYSPYTIIFPKQDIPIDLEKLNEALENARGYYEMKIFNEDPESSILRFNIKAFRNNYNLSDLTKMKLKYFAIKVGTCDVGKLDMSKEFDFSKPTPTAESVLQQGTSISETLLTVYDVIFAGVENE